MHRLKLSLTAACVGVAGLALASPADAQVVRAVRADAERIEARAVRGSISGTVSDDRGGPLMGAMVSALGATRGMAVTDDRGRFTISELPPGEYVVRAHMVGFAASRRELVSVGSAPSVFSLQLRRLDTTIGTSGTPVATVEPVKARPIVAAGFGLPRGEQPADETAAADHPHSELAWRLRHIQRGILKDTAPGIITADDDTSIVESSVFERAFGSAADIATALFTDFPFTGEVNLLTTSAVGPGQLFGGDGLPRGVAYLALAAPMSGGDWTIRAAMSEGDLSSWIVAGAFATKPGATHAYSVGLSYSTQNYQGGNPSALAAVTDGSRNVGELYGNGEWRISRRVMVDYGGRFAHYDYLETRGLFSPRAGLTLQPFDKTRVSASISQRMVAPGAEEFLSPHAAGPWLPPERTFATLRGLGSGEPDVFRVERSRMLDVGIERDFADTYVLGVRRFQQNVDDQLATLFNLAVPGGPQSMGHYYVASAGAVDASGWAFRVSSPPTSRIRGSVEYTVARAKWLSRGDTTALGQWAPASIRQDIEDLHDITTQFETMFPETATRVFVLYKINSGFTRAKDEFVRPGFDARFDVQVNQALPLTLAGTKWEVLVGMRNLFRDPMDPGSIYDELLVLRPPKRVVGGFLVRF